MKRLISILIVYLMALLFASESFAQADERGFDVRIGLSAATLDYSVHDERSRLVVTMSQLMAGIGGNISIGYRWKYVGIYYDQDFSGLWYTCYNDSESYFLASSNIVVRGFWPVTPDFQFELGIGTGVMYEDERKNDEDSDIEFNYDDSGNDDKYRNNILYWAIAFTLKLEFGFTYYFTRNIGMGAHVDYVGGFIHEERDSREYGSSMLMYHVVMPGIHARFKF